MILRVMRGRGRRDEVAALRAALAAAPLGTPAHPGLDRLHLGWRTVEGADRQIVIVSQWNSAEAAFTADANGTSPLLVAHRHLRDLEVVHFELDETIQRASEDSPVAIRMATGRFTRPGADAEMQNLLRQRAPLIGDDMAEAWVGRRLTGRQVEVAFVSAWRRLPEDRRLDEALWPDISLRYDEFGVEVYSAGAVE